MRSSQTEIPVNERVVRRVVVPVQGTDTEFLAHQRACALAAQLGVPAVGIHVAPPGQPGVGTPFAYLVREAARWKVPFSGRTIVGASVADEILAEIDALDLVVIGTRQLGTRYHVGSVAGEILKRAPCAVLMIRLS